MERLGAQLADALRARVPRPRARCARAAPVMEFVPGIKISDADAPAAPFDVERRAPRAARAGVRAAALPRARWRRRRGRRRRGRRRRGRRRRATDGVLPHGPAPGRLPSTAASRRPAHLLRPRPGVGAPRGGAARGAARTVRALAKQDARALVDALGDIGMLREGANRDALERHPRQLRRAGRAEGPRPRPSRAARRAPRRSSPRSARPRPRPRARTPTWTRAARTSTTACSSTLASRRARSRNGRRRRALDADFDFVELAAPFVEERGRGRARRRRARAGGGGGGGGLGGWLAEPARSRGASRRRRRAAELEAAEARARARATTSGGSRRSRRARPRARTRRSRSCSCRPRSRSARSPPRRARRARAPRAAAVLGLRARGARRLRRGLGVRAPCATAASRPNPPKHFCLFGRNSRSASTTVAAHCGAAPRGRVRLSAPMPPCAPR